MIDHRIYTKKRVFKKKPEYLKCLELFDIKITLTLDEFIVLHKQKFGYMITRAQAQARLGKLRRRTYIRNAGLRVYKKITDLENEKTDEFYK